METVFDCAECLDGGAVDWVLLVVLFCMPVVAWFLPDRFWEDDFWDTENTEETDSGE